MKDHDYDLDTDSIADEVGLSDPLPISADGDGYETNLEEINLLVANLSRANVYLADAVAAVAIGDRDYRAFRAQTTLAIIADDPKISVAKLDANINATAEFSRIKGTLAERQKRVDELRGFVTALEFKIRLTISLLSE